MKSTNVPWFGGGVWSAKKHNANGATRLEPNLRLLAQQSMALEIDVHVKRWQDAERFCRQYQQRLDFGHLTWPSPVALQDVAVQELIWAAIDQMQTEKAYPAYDQRILKQLMQCIEDAVRDMDDPEILDSFAELSAELLTTPASSSLSSATTPSQDAYIWARYTVPWLSPPLNSSSILIVSAAKTHYIDILENPRVLAAAGCTGHRTWEAALYLASLLGYSPYLQSLLKDANVLELGAGTGLVSFAAAMVPGGPRKVYATDGDWGAVERLERTRRRWAAEYRDGESGCEVQCDVLLWGDDEGHGFGTERRGAVVDVVLAADVTYDPVGIPDLVGTLFALLMVKPELHVILAATMRNADTLAVFEGECARRGLEIERVTDAKLGLGTEADDMGIGGVSRADVTKQTGFFHIPAAEIVVMSVTLLSDGKSNTPRIGG